MSQPPAPQPPSDPAIISASVSGSLGGWRSPQGSSVALLTLASFFNALFFQGPVQQGYGQPYGGYSAPPPAPPAVGGADAGRMA